MRAVTSVAHGTSLPDDAGPPTTEREVWGFPATEVVAILRDGTSLHRDPRTGALLDAIRREWQRIGRFKYPELGNDLEDAVQIALLKLISPAKLVTLADPGRVDLWARSIFVNTALDMLRQTSRFRRRTSAGSPGDPDGLADVLDRLPAPTAGPEDVLRQRELGALVRGALERLDTARLRYAEGLPERDIAERLGVTRETVATRLKRFRQRLRKLLGEEA